MRLALMLIMLSPLVHAGEVIDVAKERELLIHGHPAEQQEAIAKLANAGESGSAVLADIIENEKDPMAKARAGLALQEAATKSENRTEKFFLRLKRLAENQNAEVSKHGLTAVVNLKGNLAARKLIKASAKARREPELRVQVLGMLIVITDQDKAEIPFLASFLNDPSDYVRVWTAGYLGELGDTRGLPLINRVLQREPKDDTARALIMSATISAGRIGDSSSLPFLQAIAESRPHGIARRGARLASIEIELKQRKTDEERFQYLDEALNQSNNFRWAASKLSQIGGARAKEILHRAALSKKHVVSTEAARALESMDSHLRSK